MNGRWIGKGWALALVIAMAPVWAATAAPPRELAGTVTKVTDGDSLWLQPTFPVPPVEVRLAGIDAPEICQVWGTQSRDALKALVEGQRITLRTAGVDTYQRTLGSVLLDGLDVNVRMVEEGHAWSTRTKWDRGPLVKQERMAKALGRGLHSQTGAVMPKEFRAGHGPCPPTAASAVNITPAAVTLPAAATSAAYRCDGRTHCSQMSSCAEATYFLRHCPGVKMDGNRDGVPCEKQWCRP
ncbi:MAG TPA: thermonuclease family protein [Rubrivivax sp.]